MAIVEGVIRENKTGGIVENPETLASFSYDGSNYPVETIVHDTNDYYRIYVNQILSEGETIGRVDWVGIDDAVTLDDHTPIYLGYSPTGNTYDISGVSGTTITASGHDFSATDYVVFGKPGQGLRYQVTSVNGNDFDIGSTLSVSGSVVTKADAEHEDGPYWTSPTFQDEDSFKYWVTSFIPEVRTTYPAGGSPMVLRYLMVAYTGLLDA